MTPEPTRLSAQLLKTQSGYMHWCPGCNCHHEFFVEQPAEGGARWNFNDNVVQPTFHPSMHITVGPYEDPEEPEWNMPKKTVCHYFLTEGVIHFLGDCDHPYKDMRVVLPNLPEWTW